MHVLSAIFDLNEVYKWSANLLKQPLELVMPELKFEGVNTEHVGSDEKLKLSIKKIAKSITKDQKLFENHQTELAHILNEHIQSKAFQSSDWRDWTTIALSVVLGITTVMVILLFIRIKVMSAIIVTLTSKASAAAAAELPSKLIHPNLRQNIIQHVGTNETNIELDFNLQLIKPSTLVSNVILLGIFLTLIYAVWKFIQFFSEGKFGSKIYFNVSNNNEVITVGWQNFPDCISSYKFEANSFISDLQVSFKQGIPKLVVSWKSLTITHVESMTHPTLRSNKFIGCITAIRLKSLLKKPFTVIVYARDADGEFKKLDLINIDHQTKDEQTNPPQIRVFTTKPLNSKKLVLYIRNCTVQTLEMTRLVIKRIIAIFISN